MMRSKHLPVEAGILWEPLTESDGAGQLVAHAPRRAVSRLVSTSPAGGRARPRPTYFAGFGETTGIYTMLLV
jgi:hypothetical protein